MVRLYIKDKNGATAIEYALIAMFVSLAIAVAVFAFGQTLYDLFYSGLPDMLAGLTN